jgi:hypothetical protein
MLRPISAEDRAAGLAAARARINARTAMLTALKEGRVSLAEVWEAVDRDRTGYVGRTRAQTLLRALPGVGPAHGARLLAAAEVAPERRLNQLGPNQRASLSSAYADLQRSRPRARRS